LGDVGGGVFPEGEEILIRDSAEGLLIVGEFFGKELQSDVATQLQVFRLVDDTYPPAADLAEDAVMGNRLPHRLRVWRHWRKWYE
jgi:hypothetical protein